VEHCLRLANSASISPYYLASCLAVFDRSWVALRLRVTDRQDAHRALPSFLLPWSGFAQAAKKKQRFESLGYAIACSTLIKFAVRSEFAGDLIAARAWMSAIAQTDETGPGAAFAEMGNTGSSELRSIAISVQGDTQESTKRLRDAILLAEKLLWRWRAFSYIASENTSTAQRAASCAETVAKCLRRLLTCCDKAERTLLSAAVALAEPHLLRFYLDAEAMIPLSVDAEVVGLSCHADRIALRREELARTVDQLDSLAAKRNEYLLPRLIDVFDEFLAACRAHISHRAEYFAQLESGDVHPHDDGVVHRQSTVRFFWRKLQVAEPVIRQLTRVERKVAELQQSTNKLAKVELRCWAGVAAHLNAAVDPVLSASYKTSDDPRQDSFHPVRCVEAQLRVMVVEGLIGAAKQYQCEIRSEWRPEVILLLQEAAQWSHICAEKTLDSIEAVASVQAEDTAVGLWPSHYHKAADRCAMLYARAAAELRASCNLARSHHVQDQLRATVYRIASEASMREAGVVAQPDLTTEESDRLQDCVSEVNNLCVSLAEWLPVPYESVLVEICCELARRVLKDPAEDDLNVRVVRLARKVVAKGTPVRQRSFVSYLHYRRVWMDAVAACGADHVDTRKLRAVLDQFECETVYDVNFNDEIFLRLRVNVLGEVVGMKLADILLPADVRIAGVAGPAMDSEDQEFLQTHVDRAVRLAMLSFDVSGESTLSRFPVELDDTQKSLVCGLRDIYVQMDEELKVRDGQFGYFRNYEDMDGAVSEYKARVLPLLPSLPYEVAGRVWNVFPRGNSYCRFGVDPAEYEALIESLRIQWFAPLDAMVLIREAEAGCLEYKRTTEGIDDQDVRMRFEIHKLGVKCARLEFGILQAQYRGDEAVVACLQEALQHLSGAAAIAEEIVSVHWHADVEQQHLQMERCLMLAEIAQTGVGHVCCRLWPPNDGERWE
jgi:hypothetical protein